MHHLNEKHALMDLLTHLKNNLKLYGMAVQESANPKVRTEVGELSAVMLEQQYAIFEAMHKRGYYPVEEASGTRIRDAVVAHSGKHEVHEI